MMVGGSPATISKLLTPRLPPIDMTMRRKSLIRLTVSAVICTLLRIIWARSSRRCSSWFSPLRQDSSKITPPEASQSSVSGSMIFRESESFLPMGQFAISVVNSTDCLISPLASKMA